MITVHGLTKNNAAATRLGMNRVSFIFYHTVAAMRLVESVSFIFYHTTAAMRLRRFIRLVVR